MVEPFSLNFSVFTVKLVGARKFRNFMVSSSIYLFRMLILHSLCIYLCCLYLHLLIFSAKNYPSAMLSRAVNYETKDMLAFVSFSGFYNPDYHNEPKFLDR